MNEHDAPDVLEEYQAGRREAREPAAMAVLIGRTARTDGPERYTAPTLVFTSPGGATAVVPGFQPYEAAEIALVNLKPGLRRLPVPRLAELLGQYPGGLTSQEVARVLADTTDVPDRSAAELANMGQAGRAYYDRELSMRIGVRRYLDIFDKVVEKARHR